MEDNILQEALTYAGRASVIPIGKDKKPLINWKEYQTRKATEQEIKSWFEKWPEANIGIVTGEISNIAVVDVEAGGSIEGLPETLKAKTGNGGWHFYYEYEDGIENAARVRPLTDIRGEGGYVVAPPSVTQYEKDGKPCGGKYEWLEKRTIMPFPPELADIKTRSKWKELIINPIEHGTRNVDFTSIIGGLLSRSTQDEWETLVWPVVVNQNRTQAEPLPERELRTTFNSIASRERRKRSTGGQIKDITSEIKDEEIKIKIMLEKCIVHFKIKNIISNLFEAVAITWIEKTTGLGEEMSFRLKLHSDTNKEQWVRILSKAFDRKEDKEIYPWTIIVAKVSYLVEVEIKNKKQDFIATEIEAKKAEWLLEPFIQEDQINTIFGMGSSGKTLLSLFFAKFIAQDKEANILFIDYEDTAGGWKEKLTRISIYEGMEVNLDNFVYFDSEQIPLADQIDKIKDVVKKRNIKMVIVDSASLATGDSTSDEKATVRLISALKMLRSTILLIAHQRKNDGDKAPIGSIQYENQSRNVWNVKSQPDDKDQKILHCACTHTKANNTFLRREPIGYRIEYTETAINITPESAKSYFSEKFSIKDRIKDLLKDGGMDCNEIADTLGISTGSANKNLSEGKAKMMFINRDGKWFITQ